MLGALSPHVDESLLQFFKFFAWHAAIVNPHNAGSISIGVLQAVRQSLALLRRCDFARVFNMRGETVDTCGCYNPRSSLP